MTSQEPNEEINLGELFEQINSIYAGCLQTGETAKEVERRTRNAQNLEVRNLGSSLAAQANRASGQVAAVRHTLEELRKALRNDGLR